MKTPEILGEETIYAFNKASVILFKMLKTKQFDYKKSDFVVKNADRKKVAFRRACFSRSPKFSFEERDKGLALVDEINTAISTFNRVLDDWNLVHGVKK